MCLTNLDCSSSKWKFGPGAIIHTNIPTIFFFALFLVICHDTPVEVLSFKMNLTRQARIPFQSVRY